MLGRRYPLRVEVINSVHRPLLYMKKQAFSQRTLIQRFREDD